MRLGALIPAALLAGLKEMFPLSRPLATDNERSIWIKSGNQEVIEFLQAQHDETMVQAMTPTKD
jgi:hypothetical protein